MNKVVLIGRTTKSPELRYAPGTGTAVCRFTLAVNRPYKKDETDFINCVAFGKIAETIAQYVLKGRQVAITGSIRTGSYENNAGNKIYTTDVVLDGFEFIGNSNNNQGNSGAWNQSEDTGMGFGVEEPIDEGNMPF
ncbi:single-stranded DNA-binding protein [uncultured Clostridium sp.]|uniref:single-stranded DNA-binding protein n=1 Tax=uncultured Clostridium sp. TaxID=59620 RepID=UPI000822A90A|nr:MAG: single-strand binding protein family protein [Bacteriophage sp.]UVX42526.1 MAG: Single-strand binding protein family protein [Bacteriophage sp.]SCJ90732.1 Helix-destabilizing protein [uncultured Clostridium sp.]DAH55776.1 MAG TPA: Single strand binding protein [Caudoviricetes sp.]